MKVSIVILNYFHPEVIEVCLRTLFTTRSQHDYEVIVVDNGSDAETVEKLHGFVAQGWIDTLVLNDNNRYFAGGNNDGVHASDPNSDVILLLNSDVAVVNPAWLDKAVAWLEGVPEHEPSVWGQKPTIPKPGAKDIVSIGWSHDASCLPSMARPEGWCCFIRRSVWTDISEDFPWHYGLEEMLANAVRNGARCGILSQYGEYVIHREGGSTQRKPKADISNKRTPDMAGWFAGLDIETLDFTLGPDEHSSYLKW